MLEGAIFFLNEAEHFTVECNGERAAQSGEEWGGSTFYIELDKCPMLNKNLVKQLLNGTHALCNLMLSSVS